MRAKHSPGDYLTLPASSSRQGLVITQWHELGLPTAIYLGSAAIVPHKYLSTCQNLPCRTPAPGKDPPHALVVRTASRKQLDSFVRPRSPLSAEALGAYQATRLEPASAARPNSVCNAKASLSIAFPRTRTVSGHRGHVEIAQVKSAARYEYSSIREIP